MKTLITMLKLQMPLVRLRITDIPLFRKINHLRSFYIQKDNNKNKYYKRQIKNNGQLEYFKVA